MANEDFTTYTEVDADGTITVTAPKVEWVDMDSRNVISYVYKDYGVGHFGNIDHDITIQYNASDTGSHFLWWGLTNLISDLSDFWGTAEPSLMCSGYKEGAVYRFYIRSGDSGNQDWGAITVSTPYYCTVIRTATTMTVTIYTDAARTNLHDTLTITCTATTLRYLYACMSHDSSSANLDASAFSQDFDLNEGLAPISLSDSISISDSVVFKHEIPIADDVAVVDGIIYEHRLNLSDTVGIIDSPTFKRLLVLADSVNINDSIIYKHLISLNDSASVTDLAEFKRLLALSDSVNINDSVAFKRLLILTDSVGISDSIVHKHLISLADSVNVNDNIICKHILTLADNVGVTDTLLLKYILFLADSVSVNDSILYKHLINLADSVSITDSFAAKHSIFILDNISILDDVEADFADSCSAIFQLHTDTYRVFLPVPEYGGESGKVDDDNVLFDFWSGERELVHIGINSEPIVLGGTIFACGGNKETEMISIATKLINIHSIIDAHEEVRITGLNDCFDAYYIIKDFKYNTIKGSPYAYTWQLELEYKRAIT